MWDDVEGNKESQPQISGAPTSRSIWRPSERWKHRGWASFLIQCWGEARPWRPQQIPGDAGTHVSGVCSAESRFLLAALTSVLQAAFLHLLPQESRSHWTGGPSAPSQGTGAVSPPQRSPWRRLGAAPLTASHSSPQGLAFRSQCAFQCASSFTAHLPGKHLPRVAAAVGT